MISCFYPISPGDTVAPVPWARYPPELGLCPLVSHGTIFLFWLLSRNLTSFSVLVFWVTLFSGPFSTHRYAPSVLLPCSLWNVSCPPFPRGVVAMPFLGLPVFFTSCFPFHFLLCPPPPTPLGRPARPLGNAKILKIFTPFFSVCS